MNKSLVWFLAAAALLLPACAGKHKVRSTAHIYSGDSPSIKMTGKQRVGEDPVPY